MSKRDRAIYTETPALEIRQMIVSILPTTGERVSRRREKKDYRNMGKFPRTEKAFSCDDKCYFSNYFSFIRSLNCGGQSKPTTCFIKAQNPIKFRIQPLTNQAHCELY
ncbi:hypothetical protein CDAR_385531 [Caerostris darwini]|uniref:Uncharacterized protein n=1 Tax=Caerostris darwini TaxID=1538125 RepID=A0AAV4M403_9ARAC|nr:hypothetical protein CDAR_385531 [Caerostris darwini]